jgi:hypothetical protein
MEEESNVDAGQALAQETGEEEELIIVNEDDVAGLVDTDDGIGESFVEDVIVGPGLAEIAPITGFILFVMEEGEELVLPITPPSSLGSEEGETIVVDVIPEPDGSDGCTGFGFQTFLQLLTIRTWDVQLGLFVGLAWFLTLVDWDRGGSLVQRDRVHGGDAVGSSGMIGRFAADDMVDFSRPADQGVIPCALIRGQI